MVDARGGSRLAKSSVPGTSDQTTKITLERSRSLQNHAAALESFSSSTPRANAFPCFAQDTEGRRRDDWGPTAIRITDLAVTPDLTRLVTVGMFNKPPPVSSRSASGAGGDGGASSNSGTPGAPNAGVRGVTDHQMIVYDMATKQAES